MSSVQQHGFYAQRVQKELRAKNHFDKVVHLHQQRKMADSHASGFTNASSASMKSDILRNSAFANHATVTNMKRSKNPFYFVSNSSGFVPSDPNSLRDMGPTRNCEYNMDEDMNLAQKVTWRGIIDEDEQINQYISSARVTAATSGLRSTGQLQQQSCKKQSSQDLRQKQHRYEKDLRGLQNQLQQQQQPSKSRSKLLATGEVTEQKSRQKRLFDEKKTSTAVAKNERKDAASSIKKYLHTMDQMSTRSRDSKLSTKSRLFTSQLSRQKRKDQMTKENQQMPKKFFKTYEKACANDIEVEDIIDERDDNSGNPYPVYQPRHEVDYDRVSVRSSMNDGRSELSVGSNNYQLQPTRPAGIATYKQPLSMTPKSTFSKHNFGETGFSSALRTLVSQAPVLGPISTPVGTRVMGNIKNSSQAIFSPGLTTTGFSQKSVSQSKLPRPSDLFNTKDQQQAAPYQISGANPKGYYRKDQQQQHQQHKHKQSSNGQMKNLLTEKRQRQANDRLLKTPLMQSQPHLCSDVLKEYFIEREAKMSRASSSHGSYYR